MLDSDNVVPKYMIPLQSFFQHVGQLKLFTYSRS